MSPAAGWALALVAAVAILALDVYLVVSKRKSMSRWLVEACIARPFIPFLVGLAIGFLGGHLFWPLESCIRAIEAGVIP